MVLRTINVKRYVQAEFSLRVYKTLLKAKVKSSYPRNKQLRPVGFSEFLDNRFTDGEVVSLIHPPRSTAQKH
jgi:hypothetical protein